MLKTIITLILSTMAILLNAQTTQILTPQKKAIVKIASTAANGQIEPLKEYRNEGLNAGLSIEQTKEILVHLYAYAGFPRSLNAINALMEVLQERQNQGIKDTEGKAYFPKKQKGDKYEKGRNTLEKLSGTPQPKPAKGYGEFAPRIDQFLKEHLFADVFESDVLDYQTRELVTISILASLQGVEKQLQGHLSLGKNVGLSPEELDAIVLLTKSTQTIVKQPFGKGEKLPSEHFTGNAYVNRFSEQNENNTYSIGSVTFEPQARTHWHTHPKGQTLIVVEGEGCYQEKGKPIRIIKKGDVVNIPADTEHWHGASSHSSMTHIAITNYLNNKSVKWLNEVSEKEYQGK